MSHYSIHVAWSEPDEMFVAVCPELGDLSALGATQREAASQLEQAIDLALETYHAKGWLPPMPRERPAFSGQFRLRLPRSLHGWLAREAQHQGVSLNTLVVSLLAQSRGQGRPRAVAPRRRPA